MDKIVRFINTLTRAFSFFNPLLEDAFVLYYPLDLLMVLVKLVSENGYYMGILLDGQSFLFCEKRRRIHFIELFTPIGVAIEMSDCNDDYN